MGYRIAGSGPVTFDGLAIAELAQWSLDSDVKFDEVKNIRALVNNGVPVNYGWTAKFSMEYAFTPRQLSGLAIGQWNGVDVNEWTFTADGKTGESTGNMDGWQYHQLTDFGWKLEADKWQATDHYKLFLQMINDQKDNNVPVNVTSPYGAGPGWLENPNFAADGQPAKNKLSVRSAGGTLQTTDPFVSRMMASMQSVLANGYAPGYTVSLSYADSLPFARGVGLIKSVSAKGPVGKVSVDVELQGSGELIVL